MSNKISIKKLFERLKQDRENMSVKVILRKYADLNRRQKSCFFRKLELEIKNAEAGGRTFNNKRYIGDLWNISRNIPTSA